MPRSADSTPLPALPRPTVEAWVQRWRDGELSAVSDRVAEEQPVALTYQGIPFVVMMASPADLEDLGVGLTLTEGVVQRAEEIHAVELFRSGEQWEVRVTIRTERFSAFIHQRRNLTGRTGCGVCGAETVEQVIRPPHVVGDGIRLSHAALQHILSTLQAHQPWNAETGSVHAAAWGLPETGLQLVREDVGRHNALDKVIGALIRQQLDASSGFAVLTSRASYEMVQKAAIAGISIVIAVSAPTALAIRLAEQCHITLVGFARPKQHVVYSHPYRII